MQSPIHSRAQFNQPFVIDAHIHCDNGAKAFTPQDEQTRSFYSECQRARVKLAVTDSPRVNQEWINASPIPIFKLAVIREAVPNISALEEELNDPMTCGIKLSTGFLDVSVNDSSLAPVYELARKYDLPVAVHSGDPGWSKAKLKHCHPLNLDDVAKSYRDTRFILCHCGNPWFSDTAIVTANNPNVYLDCASIIDSLDHGEFEDRAEQLVKSPLRFLSAYLNDPTRIIFGSGWPELSIADYAQMVSEALPQSWWNPVFFENAMRVYRLDASL